MGIKKLSRFSNLVIIHTKGEEVTLRRDKIQGVVKSLNPKNMTISVIYSGNIINLDFSTPEEAADVADRLAKRIG